MKLNRLLTACTAGALFGAPAISTAETSVNGFNFSANVALTSDYVWRYSSQSDEKGAIQGGFDVSHDIGLYAGVWGSNVDFNEGSEGAGDPSMELDLYGGFAHEFSNGIGMDIGLINYRYPGDDDLNWVEYYAGVSYTIGGVGLGASANYSNDVFNSSEDGIFYTASAEYTFDTKFPITLSGDIGYYDFDKKVFGPVGDKYTGWRLGAAIDVKGFVFDFSYHDTNNDGEDLFGDWAGDRYVATISTSF